MKTKLALLLSSILIPSLQAQVLPPDFTLFEKTSGDYAAEWYQYIYSISTNGDYLFPDASPLADDRVYFLQRTIFYEPSLGIQTYTVPDDVYLFFPILSYEWDNVGTDPPLTIPELRQTIHAVVDRITDVHAVIDGIPLTNLLAYRTESPVFSVFLPTADNFFSLIFARPIIGLVDPMVAEGYLIMLKPLPPGLHDVRTGYTIGEPNGFSRERHYQIRSVPVSQILARQTEQLGASVTSSALSSNRQRRLLATLKGAAKSFDRGHARSGIRHLRAFQKKVRHEITRIDPILAEQLIKAAQQIIDRASRDLTAGHDTKGPSHEHG